MPSRETLLHLRFDEPDATIRPSDAKGNLADMTQADFSTMPAIVDGFTGYAREFMFGVALKSTDIVAGSTLATRDVTVQAIVRWDFDAQATNDPLGGTIICRGLSDGTPTEAIAYAVQLRVVNAALRIGEVRFLWQDTSGTVDRAQLGGYFVAPSSTSDGWLMITATRHWISETEVELQYYVGAQPVGEHFSVDGDIGGGTAGTTTVGVRNQGAFSSMTWLYGEIDELRVLNYHVTQEEVESTWLRLSKWQPAGYTTVRQLMPPGAPISDAPTSRIQRLLRGIGHALGYSNAQADNMRRNLMPDRAFGEVLERWETITGETPRALDTTKQRRRRVVSHFQQRQGVSPPGVRAAIRDQVQLNDEQIPLYAFSNDLTEDWSSGLIDTRKWWLGSNSTGWTAVSNALRLNVVAADYRVLDGTLFPWKQALLPVGGNGRDAHLLAQLSSVAGLGDNAEMGICFFNWQRGDAIFFGLRNDFATDGTYKIVRQEMRGGTLQAATVLDNTIALVPHYLHMHMPHLDDPFGGGVGDTRVHLNEWVHPTQPGYDLISQPYTFEWSTTLAGLQASGVSATQMSRMQWGGVYVRSTVALPGAIDVSFDDITLRSRYGDRPFRWYAYRDPTLPGVPDLSAAQLTAQRLAHAHTRGNVVNNLSAKCDDASSLCDSTPIGGF